MRTAISLCTTIRNRRFQFEQTFVENLDALSTYEGVEWIIVDYGSNQGEVEIYEKAVPPGWVKWIRMEAPYWHVCRAKNAAVQHSSGDIVVNFDADQWLQNVVDAARKANDDTLVHNWSGVFQTGTCGRIACTRAMFDSLGGYDESFLPCGHDDLDLIARAAASGISIEVVNCGPDAALLNSREEAVSDCYVEGLTWEEMEKSNHTRSRWNIGMGILVANSPSSKTPNDSAPK